MIHKNCWNNIAKITPMGSRLLHINLKFEVNLDIIVGHAPQANKPMEEKDRFYEELQDLWNKLLERNEKLILGGFNARTYRPTTEEEKEVIGRHAYKKNIDPDELEDDMKYNERVSRWQQLTNENYNKAEIIIAKQRHGPIGSIKMHFDANYTKFSELTTKDYDNIIE